MTDVIDCIVKEITKDLATESITNLRMNNNNDRFCGNRNNLATYLTSSSDEVRQKLHNLSRKSNTSKGYVQRARTMFEQMVNLSTGLSNRAAALVNPAPAVKPKPSKSQYLCLLQAKRQTGNCCSTNDNQAATLYPQVTQAKRFGKQLWQYRDKSMKCQDDETRKDETLSKALKLYKKVTKNLVPDPHAFSPPAGRLNRILNAFIKPRTDTQHDVYNAM